MENFRLNCINPTIEMIFIPDEIAPAWRPVSDAGVRQMCLWLEYGREVWFSCLSGSH